MSEDTKRRAEDALARRTVYVDGGTINCPMCWPDRDILPDFAKIVLEACRLAELPMNNHDNAVRNRTARAILAAGKGPDDE